MIYLIRESGKNLEMTVEKDLMKAHALLMPSIKISKNQAFSEETSKKQ
jgi:hypothetical protein